MPPDSDRLIEAALARIDETGAPADRILKDVLRRNPHLDDAGRRRVSLGVHGVRCFEGRLVHRLRALGRPTDPAHRWAAYRVDRLGEDAALGLEPGRFARLGWPTDPVGRLSAEASLPPWLAQRWIAAYGAASAMRLAAAGNRPGPVTVRARRRGRSAPEARAALRARLAAEGQPARPAALGPRALHLVGPRPDIRGSPAFRDGDFEVQDEGSQLVLEAVGARPGEVVVDLCAGSGGKTLGLADDLDGRGRLIACDLEPARLADLRGRLKARGAEAEVELLDGTEAPARLGPKLGRNGVDRVLVDAPCSGLGVLRRGPDRRWRVDPGHLSSLAELQRRLLLAGAALLRPGGRLVYATCTLGTIENHPVADAGDASSMLRPVDVLPERRRVELRPDVEGTDGFFLAAWRRR